MLHLLDSARPPVAAPAAAAAEPLACGMLLPARDGEAARLVVERPAELCQPAVATELRRALPRLGAGGRVEVGPLDRGEELVAAAGLALLAHHCAPAVQVHACLPPGAIAGGRCACDPGRDAAPATAGLSGSCGSRAP